MKLEEFLQKTYNYNPDVKNNIQTYIDQWKSWYKGNVKDFHNYFIYNGNRKLKQKRYTLNMAKEISEDWSDIIWSEKCKISLKNDKSQNLFDEITDNVDLYSTINQAIEKSGALGTVATVTSVYDIKENKDAMTLDMTDAKIRVDVVDVDNIYPLSWNNREVTECAFASVHYYKGDKYVVLSVHLKDGDNYKIKNHLFKDSNGNLTEIVNEDNTLKEFNTKSNVKWFSIFKPLLTNNLFSSSPFGIPHYANALDKLKVVDLAFDSLQNELKLSKKRIFVRADMFNYDDGSQRLTFDPEDASIYQLPTGATKDDLIQPDAEGLRTGQFIEALNTGLNVLGNSVGFGENHYHFDGTNLSTATAVVSSNSKLFRRKKKLEIGYESSIYDLANSICYASSLVGNKIDTEDMVIQFDDSIIEDKEAESIRALREVGNGLLGKDEYRMKIFGETEEIAKEKLKQISEETEDIEKVLKEGEDEE